jgi:hypothetical protein
MDGGDAKQHFNSCLWQAFGHGRTPDFCEKRIFGSKCNDSIIVRQDGQFLSLQYVLVLHVTGHHQQDHRIVELKERLAMLEHCAGVASVASLTTGTSTTTTTIRSSVPPLL